MAAAAVAAAGMGLLTVMMVAGGGFGVNQRTGQQVGHALIRIAGATGVQPDAGLGQSHLGAGTDTAAEQAVHAVRCQESGQGTVAAAVGGDYLGGDDGAVLNVVQLELFRVAEVTVYIAVFIGNCDFHVVISFLF